MLCPGPPGVSCTESAEEPQAGPLGTQFFEPENSRSFRTRGGGRTSGKKVRVALARKLAVLMHRVWTDGTEFAERRRPGRERLTATGRRSAV